MPIAIPPFSDVRKFLQSLFGENHIASARNPLIGSKTPGGVAPDIDVTNREWQGWENFAKKYANELATPNNGATTDWLELAIAFSIALNGPGADTMIQAWKKEGMSDGECWILQHLQERLISTHALPKKMNNLDENKPEFLNGVKTGYVGHSLSSHLRTDVTATNGFTQITMAETTGAAAAAAPGATAQATKTYRFTRATPTYDPFITLPDGVKGRLSQLRYTVPYRASIVDVGGKTVVNAEGLSYIGGFLPPWAAQHAVPGTIPLTAPNETQPQQISLNLTIENVGMAATKRTATSVQTVSKWWPVINELMQEAEREFIKSLPVEMLASLNDEVMQKIRATLYQKIIADIAVGTPDRGPHQRLEMTLPDLTYNQSQATVAPERVAVWKTTSGNLARFVSSAAEAATGRKPLAFKDGRYNMMANFTDSYAVKSSSLMAAAARYTKFGITPSGAFAGVALSAAELLCFHMLYDTERYGTTIADVASKLDSETDIFSVVYTQINLALETLATATSADMFGFVDVASSSVDEIMRQIEARILLDFSQHLNKTFPSQEKMEEAFKYYQTHYLQVSGKDGALLPSFQRFLQEQLWTQTRQEQLRATIKTLKANEVKQSSQILGKQHTFDKPVTDPAGRAAIQIFLDTKMAPALQAAVRHVHATAERFLGQAPQPTLPATFAEQYPEAVAVVQAAYATHVPAIRMKSGLDAVAATALPVPQFSHKSAGPASAVTSPSIDELRGLAQGQVNLTLPVSLPDKAQLGTSLPDGMSPHQFWFASLATYTPLLKKEKFPQFVETICDIRNAADYGSTRSA